MPASSEDFRVFPQPLVPPLPIDLHSFRFWMKVGGIALPFAPLVYGVLYVLLGIGARIYFPGPYSAGAFVYDYSDYCLYLAYPMTCLLVLRLAPVYRRFDMKSTEENHANEAGRTTSDLVGLLSSNSTLQTKMAEHLDEAVARLTQAQREFEQNAYAPFWDLVENAAICLNRYRKCASNASGLAANYYKKLKGREHTFPLFPQAENFPDPTSTLEMFHKVVRLGQTNFQFANIWEHRRTRAAIIEGFKTLGEAIDNLGSTVEREMSSLRDTLHSDLAKIVEEQIRTRNDVIQRRKQ